MPCPADGIEFLGFRFEGCSGQIRVSPKNLLKFKQRVKEITRRKRGVSMETRLRELSYYLRGWGGYFGLVPVKSFFSELDKWIRRRLRCCYWKQWRKPQTRISKLLSLGLSPNEAIPFGSCSRGHWHMSHCRSVQQTLSNDYLASQGLVSLLNIWSKLAPKFRNAWCGPACQVLWEGPAKSGPYPDPLILALFYSNRVLNPSDIFPRITHVALRFLLTAWQSHNRSFPESQSLPRKWAPV